MQWGSVIEKLLGPGRCKCVSYLSDSITICRLPLVLWNREHIRVQWTTVNLSWECHSNSYPPMIICHGSSECHDSTLGHGISCHLSTQSWDHSWDHSQDGCRVDDLGESQVFYEKAFPLYCSLNCNNMLQFNKMTKNHKGRCPVLSWWSLLPVLIILSIAISSPIMTAIMLTSMHFRHPRLVLIPALLTRMSMQRTLKNSSALSNKFLNSSSFVTSHFTKQTRSSPNLFFISASVFSPLSCHWTLVIRFFKTNAWLLS